jgi:hypothetical protein
MSKYSNAYILINNRRIGSGYPVYIVAEMSANHGQDFEQAVKIIEAAKEAGADAIKIQTYTPDTLTINCNNEYFQIGKGRFGKAGIFMIFTAKLTPLGIGNPNSRRSPINWGWTYSRRHSMKRRLIFSKK